MPFYTDIWMKAISLTTFLSESISWRKKIRVINTRSWVFSSKKKNRFIFESHSFIPIAVIDNDFICLCDVYLLYFTCEISSIMFIISRIIHTTVVKNCSHFPLLLNILIFFLPQLWMREYSTKLYTDENNCNICFLHFNNKLKLKQTVHKILVTRIRS